MIALMVLEKFQGLTMSDFYSIKFEDNNLFLLDQTKLPLAEEYIKTDDYERIAIAIERLEVRGAPAIGISASYAIALAFKYEPTNRNEHFDIVYNRLKETRPTAVNLFWALERMKQKYSANNSVKDIYTILVAESKAIHDEDINMCDEIGKNGSQIFKKISNVLTHCNTGKLATGGNGTAFSVIEYAFNNGMVKHVFADETRPLLQGSRLTSFELEKSGIPFSINTDSTAAFLMQKGKIDIVITGADRIALNGDSANKIGTYNLAVLCNYHNIPFYIAAPTSTVDLNCKTGDDIKIEFRGKEEINSFNNVKITSEAYEVYSPAFDVTPNSLITGIITERALHLPPYNFSTT